MYMCGGGGGTLQANISIRSLQPHIITIFIALLTLSAETEPVTPLTLWSNGETMDGAIHGPRGAMAPPNFFFYK